jgi:hypothetical protein
MKVDAVERLAELLSQRLASDRVPDLSFVAA